jgi:hypothetical protein
MRPAHDLDSSDCCLYASTTMLELGGRGAGPAGVVPLTTPQPPAKIIVDPPWPATSHGKVFIQYRSENLRIVPVFGPKCPRVSPGIGTSIHRG